MITTLITVVSLAIIYFFVVYHTTPEYKEPKEYSSVDGEGNKLFSNEKVSKEFISGLKALSDALSTKGISYYEEEIEEYVEPFYNQLPEPTVKNIPKINNTRYQERKYDLNRKSRINVRIF